MTVPVSSGATRGRLQIQSTIRCATAPFSRELKASASQRWHRGIEGKKRARDQSAIAPCTARSGSRRNRLVFKRGWWRGRTAATLARIKYVCDMRTASYGAALARPWRGSARSTTSAESSRGAWSGSAVWGVKVVYPTYGGPKRWCRTWPAGFEGFAGHSQPPQNPDLTRSVGGRSARSRFLSVLALSRLHQ